MVVGWRIGEDVEKIANLPDGKIVFDILSGTATHSSGVDPDLWVAKELQVWFEARLKALNVPVTEVEAATLEVAVMTDRIKTTRKSLVSFDFECHSSVVTANKNYLGNLVEKHTYHNRTQ
jgi:hypothetical protein